MHGNHIHYIHGIAGIGRHDHTTIQDLDQGFGEISTLFLLRTFLLH